MVSSVLDFVSSTAVRLLLVFVLAQALRWHLEGRVLVYGNKTVVFPASPGMSLTDFWSKCRCWPSFGFLVVSMPLAETESVRPPPRDPEDLTSSTVPVS